MESFPLLEARPIITVHFHLITMKMDIPLHLYPIDEAVRKQFLMPKLEPDYNLAGHLMKQLLTERRIIPRGIPF